MAEHRFAIGESVRMRRAFPAYRADQEVFRVTGRLPAKDNSPQYRIRNEGERHERVVTEDGLEAVELAFGRPVPA